MAEYSKDDIVSRHQVAIAPYMESLNEYGTITGYLSPTRLLKRMTDPAPINAWKARVGEQEAERITLEASHRGTALHNAIEARLAGNPVTNPPYHYTIMEPVLQRIDPILSEALVYSEFLGMSGKLDCLGWFDGKLAIIDFKSSRRPKKREYLQSYMYQVAFYSMMLHDCMGIVVPDAFLLNVLDHDPESDFPNTTQIFHIQLQSQIPKALQLYQKYQNGYRECEKL